MENWYAPGEVKVSHLSNEEIEAYKKRKAEHIKKKLFQSTLSQGERQLHIVHACSIPSKYRYFTKTIYNTTSKNQ